MKEYTVRVKNITALRNKVLFTGNARDTLAWLTERGHVPGEELMGERKSKNAYGGWALLRAGDLKHMVQIEQGGTE